MKSIIAAVTVAILATGCSTTITPNRVEKENPFPRTVSKSYQQNVCAGDTDCRQKLVNW